MKTLNEPYYKKEITGQLKRFDERDTVFAREGILGNQYIERGIGNLKKGIPGKTILEHSMRIAAQTVDLLLRKNTLAREGNPIRNNQYQLKNPDPAAMTELIKEIARWFGADLVGITELNPLWIYSHWGENSAIGTNAAKAGDLIDIPVKHNRVIVLIFAMDYELIRWTPHIEPASAIGYSKMAWCASSLATFIRELGYSAIPCGNQLGLSIPMAIDAGLGETGRNGLLMTRGFGPRVRIAKVLTDLPLFTDSPIEIGVQKFCNRCKRCAKYCPSQAITYGPKTDKALDRSNSEGVLKWQVNAMNCFKWWVKSGAACAVCIRVCPWNKPNTVFHRFVSMMAEHDLFPGFLIFMDKFVGYGRQAKIVGCRSIQDPSVIEIPGITKS